MARFGGGHGILVRRATFELTYRRLIKPVLCVFQTPTPAKYVLSGTMNQRPRSRCALNASIAASRVSAATFRRVLSF